VYSNYYPQRVVNPACVGGNCPMSTVTSGSTVMQASMSQAVHDGGEIVLFSPSESGKDFQYSLNGSPYLIKPGGVHRFLNDRTHWKPIDTNSKPARTAWGFFQRRISRQEQLRRTRRQRPAQRLRLYQRRVRDAK
jgi:hypothetical protein